MSTIEEKQSNISQHKQGKAFITETQGVEEMDKSKPELLAIEEKPLWVLQTIQNRKLKNRLLLGTSNNIKR